MGTEDLSILFPEQSDEWRFKKDIAVIRYIHWCSVTYSINRINSNYDQCAESLILWGNALFPIIDDKIKDKIEAEKYREMIMSKNKQCDKFIDRPKNKQNLKQFNNYLMDYERDLRVLEHKLGIYMNKGVGIGNALTKI